MNMNKDSIRARTSQVLLCQRYRNLIQHLQSDLACDTMLFSTMTTRGTVLVIPFNHVSKANLVWQAAASHAQAALLSAIPYRQEFDGSPHTK